MKSISRTAALKQSILELEKKQSSQEQELREHFKLTLESLKPSNIIKSTLHDISSSSEIKQSIASAILGTISFFITRKVFKGSSSSSSNGFLKSLLKKGLMSLLQSNGDLIHNLRHHLFHFISKRHSS